MYLFRESYLGKSKCVKRLLPVIPKGTKYTPLTCKFFPCDSLNLYVVKRCLIKRIKVVLFISVWENGVADIRENIFYPESSIGQLGKYLNEIVVQNLLR